MKKVNIHFTEPFDLPRNDAILVVFIFTSFILLVFCKCHDMSAYVYLLCVCVQNVSFTQNNAVIASYTFISFSFLQNNHQTQLPTRLSSNVIACMIHLHIY